MRLRDYFGSFFTRDYWRALAALLTGVTFMTHTAQRQFWDRVDEEADAQEPPQPE